MFRFTLRNLARKAPAKAGSKIAATVSTATAAYHTAPAVAQTGVNIPPIPGVRSVRAFRSQKMAALQPQPVLPAGKKAAAPKDPKQVKAAVKPRSSKKTMAPEKTAVLVKELQAKKTKTPKIAAKVISKRAKVRKARK
ncbi:h1 histone-like protein [Leishmania braziliensis MHOM/BR/75/M2904]|uniref:H1 histone-like protein n=3 Tax=Viannia TaxID=37616 RepID=A4HM32_LEIBR|nr:h1 histone-like protein [Leishmania braziliensis MHOM/BR/75/M2904]KAI5687164.1 hypothetical protein MNV84_07215 [Leishmania braziliensis]CAJ2479840.1 unnamed protein product [Leishmania braziliensis]CAJ2480144.1 unnamed protein product [Leishmania braziliensis]CAM40884.1 h1 histone-like protein [Leishmania braziliensis MHOM/BR/75/M2904]SYZ69292.1 h1_histone-like_protein [Leishmania braziliensis MHOM/BR/75/M2904]